MLEHALWIARNFANLRAKAGELGWLALRHCLVEKELPRVLHIAFGEDSNRRRRAMAQRTRG